MTKKGYTHVLIPEFLHSVLRENAKDNKTSIWRYIEGLLDGNPKRPKVIDSRSILAGVRGFKSLPPHLIQNFQVRIFPIIPSALLKFSSEVAYDILICPFPFSPKAAPGTTITPLVISFCGVSSSATSGNA